MFDQVYRELARKLDSIPPGFPATESGVELQLLARLYTREEATIVTAMRLTYETAGDIAARAAMDSGEAYDILSGAARKGLVRTRAGEVEPTFALNPQAVGFAGMQLGSLRHDAVVAELWEQFALETRGGSLSDAPAAFRVIAVEESIPFNLAIHPHEQATEMLTSAKSWGVLDCICRTQARQAGRGCSHPLESCLVFAPVGGAFDDDGSIRAISQGEALQILREARDRGSVHTTGNFGDHSYNICNCCACCCALLRGVIEFQRPTVIAHSDFAATVDEVACEGCSDCIERCDFGALSLLGGVCAVDHARCVGCGLCVLACSHGALSLGRRPEGEILPRPADFGEWMAEHAKGRGISLV
jgi:electron transport complex protein RnfB